jgi:hypothetical protein
MSVRPKVDAGDRAAVAGAVSLEWCAWTAVAPAAGCAGPASPSAFLGFARAIVPETDYCRAYGVAAKRPRQGTGERG